MSDEQGLIQAIAGALDDDTVRLAYADWLDEYRPTATGSEQAANRRLWEGLGGPGPAPSPSSRAWFIRIQIECARKSLHDPQRGGLDQLAIDILSRHNRLWNGSVTGLPFLAKDIVYRRGFIEEIRIRASILLNHAVRLFEEVPTLCGIRCMDADAGHIGQLAASEHLQRLFSFSLRVHGWLETDAAPVASSPFLTQLRSFTLTDSGFQLAGAIALATNPALRQLQAVRLDGCCIGNGHLSHLVQISTLEELGLTRNDIGNHGVEELANSPHLARLWRLDLTENRHIGDIGRRALAQSTALNGLQSLRLDQGQRFANSLRRARVEAEVDGLRKPLPSLEQINGLTIAEYQGPRRGRGNRSNEGRS